MFNKKIKTMVMAVAGVSAFLMGITVQASSKEPFNFYLNPGDEKFATNSITRTSNDGSAWVHTKSISGAKGVIYQVYKGANNVTKAQTVSKKGSKEMVYTHTPNKGEKIRLQGFAASNTSPVSVSGTWED